MAYVVPNSTVVLLKNISLTPTYENTVDYDNATAQYNDMYAHKLGQWDRCTYVGKNKQQGTIRLESTQGLLMQQATYMMFKNTNYEDKWFYAFVTDVTWVNNVTWEVSFVLDVIQTYYFDFTYSRCFIERQHSVTDEVGDNIIDEGLETGEYEVNYWEDIEAFKELVPVVATTLADDGTRLEPSAGDIDIVSNVDGFTLGGFIYKFDTLASWNKFFSNVQDGNEDGIIDVYTVPVAFAGDSKKIIGKSTTVTTKFNKPQVVGNLRGYVPKNKKLYTYPFTYLRLTNMSGNSNDYRFELFKGDNQTPLSQCTFQSSCTRMPNPQGYVYPQFYDGVNINYDEGISVTDFPKLLFVTDAYKAWLAQTSNSRTLQMLGAGASAVAGFAGTLGGIYAGAGSALSGNASTFVSTSGADYSALGQSSMGNLSNNLPMGIGGLSAIAGLLAQKEDHKVRGQRAVGNLSVTWNSSRALNTIRLECMCPQVQYSKIIDDYFDKYGYKQNIIAVPNIKARPNWNYIKTVGCNVKASLPSSLVGQLNAIHDSGITFWKNLDSIGNYTLDNRPV